MLTAKNRFIKNISRIKNTYDLYNHLNNELKFPSQHLGDLIRSDLVFLVSALDRFVHDLVRIGMIKSFQGHRPKTNAYLNFSIPLSQVDTMVNSSIMPPELIFEQQILNNHKHLAFQEPDKISNALSLIWNEPHKWQKISQKIGEPENDTKTKLKNIVIRRNQIVHEADMDLQTGDLQEIEKSDVEMSIEFVEKICLNIYELIQ